MAKMKTLKENHQIKIVFNFDFLNVWCYLNGNSPPMQWIEFREKIYIYLYSEKKWRVALELQNIHLNIRSQPIVSTLTLEIYSHSKHFENFWAETAPPPAAGWRIYNKCQAHISGHSSFTYYVQLVSYILPSLKNSDIKMLNFIMDRAKCCKA